MCGGYQSVSSRALVMAAGDAVGTLYVWRTSVSTVQMTIALGCSASGDQYAIGGLSSGANGTAAAAWEGLSLGLWSEPVKLAGQWQYNQVRSC